MNQSDALLHAIVTGSASGLGRAIAVRLAQDGWQIALADVNDEANRETLQLVEAAGGSGQLVHLDVSNPEAWREAIDGLKQGWPHLDLLVNNAGVVASGSVGQLSLEDWQWAMGINLMGAVYGCHYAVGWMKQNPRGAHIANVASIAAYMCAPDMAAYNTTKAGLVGLSETLYSELRPNNIGVTILCPGFVQTNILRLARYHSQAQTEYAAQAMKVSPISADELADRLLQAIQRKDLYLFLPSYTWWDWWRKRLTPRRYLDKIGRGFHQLYANQQAPE